MLIGSVVPLGLLVAFALLLRQEEEARSPKLGRRLGILLAPLLFAGFLSGVLWVAVGRADLLLLGCALLLSLPLPLGRREQDRGPGFLESRWIPVATGVLSSATIAWVWGSWNPTPVVHDESAYLLQARIFASGRWTAPGLPLPEFFEQMHVFVTPFVAGKYPPGHALALTAGLLLGVPALLPILLNGVAGSLVFSLSRRLAGGAVALLAWLLWLLAPATLPFRASYLSESTTTALWLLALWALWDWRERGSVRSLLLLSASAAWGAITRPWTMLALALPMAFVVFRVASRHRAWRELLAAAALGAAIVAILPLWSFQTTGDWRRTPYRFYSQLYYPYEWAGFGAREEGALRPLPTGMEPFERQFQRIHREHTVASLPDTLERRLHAIGSDMWGSGRTVLLPFAIVGALGIPAEGAFALFSSAVLTLAYLYFAHSPAWTVYYLEIQPVLAFVTALGLWGVLRLLLSAAGRRLGPGSAARRRGWGLVLVSFALLLPSFGWLEQARLAKRQASDYQRSFQEKVRRLPAQKTIVFVRYAPWHDVHRSLVENEPDLDRARAWIVHDLGPRNASLASRASDRVPYLYDERRGAFVRLSGGGFR